VVTLAATAGGLDERMLQGFSAILRAHVVNPYSESARQIVPPPLEAAVGSSSEVRKTSALAPAQLRAVTTAVRNDLARNWSTRELAGLVGRSIGHFSRAFRSATGSAPRQWIIQQRIESALDRLTLTDDSLVDIAHDCGFTDQTHFTRTFSRIVGTSPGAWRRRHATRPKQPGRGSRPAN
jgi:transcriptional regulator GlxA family with amidase domain